MKHYSLPFIILMLLITSSTTTAYVPRQQDTMIQEVYPTGATIYVDDSNTQGPWNGTYEYPYQYIRDGILHAQNNDIVYVFSGLYNETITINTSLYLRGEHKDSTIIDGGNNRSIINVTSDNVRIRHFTMRNSGGYHGNAGIISTANSTMITDCIIYRTRAGVLLSNCSDTGISGCTFHTNGFGITDSSSVYTTIDSCTFYHNGIGVYLNHTHLTTITKSYADSNGIGIYGFQAAHITIADSAARDNDDNEGGMFFSSCTYVNIINCHLSHNGVGVSLLGSSACYIDHCNFSLNTHFALKLREALSSIIITHCLFAENLRYGIHADDSAFTLSWSNLMNNANYGVFTTSSTATAQYNWWGFPTGPAHTGIGTADRVTWDRKTHDYTPWLTFPMPDVGTDWNLDKIFPKPDPITPWSIPIALSGNDTDGDGAPDWWEQKYDYNPSIPDNHQTLDPDNDALTNIEECYMDSSGASPFHRDIFLEFDWTKSMDPNATNKPQASDITQMIDAFVAHNITLHVDTGSLGGGEELPTAPFITYAQIIDYYWDYFLHNDLNTPRHRIFHYGLLCDYSEGRGFAVVPWDNLNAFIISAYNLETTYPSYTRSWLTVAASMHELGHTLGLLATTFKGIDNSNSMKPIYKEFWLHLNYRSILNYLYTWMFMDFSDGTHGLGDYDDWGNLDFSYFKNTDFSYPQQVNLPSTSSTAPRR
ncbi:MAG: right-handed parallel beta-helix repeat-containing protein [Candidatus Thermoplasmatota archaeon]|nr:right-handed parallel beta-helix repeat-containing protein [Candidatus Thermoplasmatota archaeon]